MIDRNDPLIRCHGKEIYPSKAAAIDARAERIRRLKYHRHPHKEKKRDATRLQPYRCPSCHDWRLGTRNDGKKMR